VYRTRLLLAIMLLVCAITAVILYLAQRSALAEVQGTLQHEFQSQLGFLRGAQEVRRAVIAERCRILAKSVRMRAAIEEDSIEDVYRTADVELRDVVAREELEAGQSSISLHANFYRLLNASGGVLVSHGEGAGANMEPWEARLASSGEALGEQHIGYLMVRDMSGRDVLDEVIATPIVTTDLGSIIGSLVLGFKPVEVGAGQFGGGMRSGVWTAGELHMPSLPEPALSELGDAVGKAIRGPFEAGESVVVEVGGVQHLLFHKLLNPGSRFAPAYHVCIYPLTVALARQNALKWKIILSGGIVLLAGFAASHVVSERFSAPVERLAEDSVIQTQHRRQAEAALEITEQKYRGIFENAVEGIFILGPDGSFQSANPALLRLFRLESLNAILSTSARRLFADKDAFDDFLRRAALSGGIAESEAEMIRTDGRAIWVLQNARAIRDAGGAVMHIEGTFVDVTARKRSADQLLALNTELQAALATVKTTQRQIIQQERLRALGQMASGIAHDFNNALVPILGFCELLILSPAVLAERQKAIRYLETIQTAAKDASSVVSRLREFYRADKGDTPFEPVHLKRLAEQIVTLTRPKWKDQAQAAGATVEIVLELEPVPPVAGDESALREVLTNLVFNAVDAMPNGGTITLRTRREGDSAVIEVADTGTGMTDDVRRRCLEPFFSTKGERGTGLGLSMVFGIVQRHSGTLDIQSELGRGTTFILKLPLQDSAHAARATATEPQAWEAVLRVLVVDDEAPVRDTLAAVLTADGHEVDVATEGAEGLRQFLAGKFDLVITDKAMPGMSGDQMAVAIKQASPKTPIILLTGFGLFLDKKDFPSVDVLASKPIRIPALRDAITSAMSVV
jgi:PAS domain S-box-containing protein